MKSCQHSETIAAYRLGLLTEKEIREFEAHLKTCSLCQQELRIESAIDKELSVEFQPEFIENRVLARVQVRRAQDMRSFWLYALRMGVYGIVAMVVGMFFIPHILEFPIGQYLDISRYIGRLSALANVPYALFFIVATGYILIIISSLYSFNRIKT